MNPEDRYCAARSLYQANQLPEARVMLETLLHEEMAPRLAVRVSCLQGTIQRQTGEISGALEQFDAALRYLPDAEDLEGVMAGTIAFERGLALWQGRRPYDALEALRAAQMAFDADGQRRHTLWAMLWRSWLLAEVKRPHKAQPILDQARELVESVDDELRLSLTQARVSLARNNGHDAALLMDRLTSMQPGTVPEDLFAIACALSSQGAALVGNTEAADGFSTLASLHGARCPDWRVQHIITEAARRVAELRVGR